MRKLFSIVLILLLAGAMTFAAVEQQPLIKKNDDMKKMVSSDVWNKLKGPLKDVVKMYRKNGTLEKKTIADLKALKAQKNGKMIASQYGKTISVDSKENMGNAVYDSLIFPSIQKRWKGKGSDIIRVLVRYKGNPNELKNHNVKVRTVSDLGDYKIVSTEIAAKDLEAVASLPSVLKMSPVIKRSPDNDRGTISTGAAKIRGMQAGMYTKGYTGKGVVVGVIDSGIDWSHGDFNTKDGSRVKYLWDAENDTPGKSPAEVFGGALSGLDWGTVWTKEDIDAGLCTEVDTNGHGTHVTGSAAGNGNATGNYTGMAPNADIVFVKGINAAGNDGILFIFEMAKMMGKPCAINMSYGPTFQLQYVAMWPENYPADGSSEDAQQINGWYGQYGPGHVCIKSGGNNGAWHSYANSEDFPFPTTGHHSGASLASSSTHTLNVIDYGEYWMNNWGYYPQSWDYPTMNIGIWYDSPIQVTFISPNGNTIGPMMHGTENVDADWTGMDGVVYYYMDNPPNPMGSHYAYFDFADYFGVRFYPTPGDWQILVEPIGDGTGRVDMWAGELNILMETMSFWLDDGTIHSQFKGDYDNVHSHYVLDEGASPFEISVSWWTTKEWWPSIDGLVYHFTTEDREGHIAPGASPGPARDLRTKPDISAPGNVIISALSADAATIDPFLDPDGMHHMMMGASMATPHVCGGTALMLEKNGSLNIQQLRNQIASFARNDRFVNQYGPNAFGYGKFNVKPLDEPPVAMVSASQIGGAIVFDGTESYDPEGFALQYEFDLEVLPINEGETPVYNTSYNAEGSILTVQPDSTVSAYYRVKFRVCDDIRCSGWILSDWIAVHN